MRGTFWSTGQVIMSAVAGIDLALWDLKGKRLGVPVYDLLGGPTRERVRVYRHLAGDTAEAAGRGCAPLAGAGVHGASLRPAGRVRRPLAHALGSPGVDRRRRSRRRSRCAARSATRSSCSSTRTRCSARPRRPTSAHALEPYRLYFYEDPIRPFNAQSLRTGPAKGEPAARDRRAVRAQVGVPAADRGRAGRLPAHRHGARRAASPRRRRSWPPARCTASAPRSTTPAHRSTARPACTSTGACRTSASRSGWSSSRSTSSSRTRLARRTATSTPPRGPGLGLEFDEAEARKRPSRDAELPQRYWPDGSVGDYGEPAKHRLSRRAALLAPMLRPQSRRIATAIVCSLRPCLVTSIAPRRRAMFRQTAPRRRTSWSSRAATSIVCSRQPGANGDCCSW